MSPREDVRNGSTPTVLLVHGAFADGSIWAEVIAELQAAGIAVMAPANPLRGLAPDAAYIASTAAAIDGPVLLAGIPMVARSSPPPDPRPATSWDWSSSPRSPSTKTRARWTSATALPPAS